MTRKKGEDLRYYATIFKKIRNKKYELFVISRIVHRLSDPELEFNTQQLVKAGNKHFYLDLYLPQLNISIEVDESYHAREVQAIKDREREKVILNAASLEKPMRISVSGKSFDEVCAEIDDVAKIIKRRKSELKSAKAFIPFEKKYDTGYWLRKRKLSVSDDARFKKHIDVAKIFGKNMDGHQKALIKLPDGGFVWFPKIYDNDQWENDLLMNGKKIVQKRVPDSKPVSKESKPAKKSQVSIGDKMYVFAHHRDEFGDIYYAFKGVFELKERARGETVYLRLHEAMQFDGRGRYGPSS
jgi:very-short-patch-repair endonuclease